MAYTKHQTLAAAVWQLAAAQHGVVAQFQLLELGYTMSAIKHRVAAGRLHPVRPGAYAVGRPRLTREGDWMAAVLSHGPHAVLSHGSAAALWGIRNERERCIHVTMLPQVDRRQAGIMPHRRSTLRTSDMTRHRAIPVTTPVRTLVDLAVRLPVSELEATVNEADKLDLVDPEHLRADLDGRTGQQGARPLRTLSGPPHVRAHRLRAGAVVSPDRPASGATQA